MYLSNDVVNKSKTESRSRAGGVPLLVVAIIAMTLVVAKESVRSLGWTMLEKRWRLIGETSSIDETGDYYRADRLPDSLCAVASEAGDDRWQCD